MVEKVVIMGAAGRDFHNFNVYFRNNPRYRVVAFTAAQIPDIEGRLYPPELAGPGYPEGIPIHPEEELAELIRRHKIDLVAFSYSDVPHVEVMHKASICMAEGADFILIGATYTMLRSAKPVVAVCAVRTGCGKSQTTRKVCEILRNRGLRVVAVRHPMPYGDIRRQEVQRFSSYDDFDRHRCTIEEREEYEPLVDQGIVVYAGVDYEKILRRAEGEADVIVWDGGNNDTPFYFPDVHIVLLDPHRPGHELTYYPGETNLRMAHIAVINKVDTAPAEGIRQVRENIERIAPQAEILLAESPVLVSDPEKIRGRRVAVVEDGPTLTHGEMPTGAGMIAAQTFGAAQVVDPKPYAAGSLRETYERYPHMGPVVPAMGYSPRQIADLEKTLNAVPCDLVLFATPIQLTRIVTLKHPTVRVRYEYRDHGSPSLEEALKRRLPSLFESEPNP
ncbi:Predicted GTPase [Desulfacinum infernum DSM 9756]|uniref:Predicted GTPase n=1 Tax=Desulfacinum infernum DSM 9756 TaxID=1121391 RepID=A0A1M4XTN0_9BACT|nr:cyclic 2,3-diphosphoglycerate synthase [Desulfacinum infernum]SHE96750.1 Predicted GTPase [Desulfacinum infernum DSM 9756]